LDVLSNGDFVKTKIKDAALSSFRFYNANVPQNLSDEELEALEKLSKNNNLIVQKADKGNSVVLVDKDVYIRHMENILKDNTKFEKVKIKTGILNFQVNHQKRINDYLKSLKDSDSLSVNQYKKIKAVGSKPGILYGLCKVHKAIVDTCPPFRPILSAIGTPSYKIAKFLVPILSKLTVNEFTIKDSFSFAKEIVQQDSSLYMASLDVDSLFTNIPLDETINICTESIYDQSDTVEGLSKSEFKELLSLAAKESYFIFNEFLYKQIDGVAMGSPLGPTLANAFLCFYEKKWLDQCPNEFKPVFYRRYVDDIFLLFKSQEHLIKFRDYFNKCHPNMKFSFEQEKNGKLSFLDVEVSREENKFVTSVYRKPTFSGVYTHFESFLPSTYKFGMIYTLVFRCFRICSDWTKFHNELKLLKEIFLKNGYPTSFIDKCFKTFLDQLYISKPLISTVEKKTLTLVLPFLGDLSLQTKTKIQKVLKRTLGCCKFQVVFKSQRKLSNILRFKDRLPYDLVSHVVYRFKCGRCNSTYIGESERHLKVRSGEHIGISPLTFKKVKSSDESSVRDHLLFCDHSPSFDDFTIITHGTNKFLLEIKESLLIELLGPELNRHIRSAPLYLFDKK